MDLSILDEQILAMDDSFLISKPEAMDDEVSQILKKWNKTNTNLNQVQKKDFNYVNSNCDPNETFDTRTFTRPKRRSTNNDHTFNISSTVTETEKTLEPGVASVNLPSLMKRSWLNDVSPPNSICRSMDFQNNDNLINSLITSGDFTNVSFLLNGNDGIDENNPVSPDVSPSKNLTRNLMDFTFNVCKPSSNTTFTAEAESHHPHDLMSSNSDNQNSEKNLTYDALKNGNLTWNDIQDHHDALNNTIVQSTPVHTSVINRMSSNYHFDHTMSPISSLRAEDEAGEDKVIIRNLKARNLVNDISLEDYRNSLEDQCEFLLNEETIKLSSRVCGDTFECLDLKTALIQSANANENDFDLMLDTFNVKKSLESEKLLQSVDNIKQRHSIINFEKQREEKQKKDDEYDNKVHYDAMNKSSERLLRRSRQYDDVNLQLQKQQTEIITNKSAKTSELEELSDEVVDKNNRDRFKTIKLNKKLQSGMVVVNDEQEPQKDDNSSSPGAIKERTNQINQIKHDNEESEFKKPAPSKLSKFGFSRPSYRSRNDLSLPLKANSTDSLDNDEPRVSNLESHAKSPMGVKSKSIHNLMFSMNSGLRAGSYSNLKLAPTSTGSQSNIRAPRTSSLVRPSFEIYKSQVSSSAIQLTQMRAPTSRKTSLVRPSSGYYGNSSKRLDSDNESGNSLSSSSASSRNSVHAIDPKSIISNNPCPPSQRSTGTIPKPSGLRPPSNLRAPQAKSGLLPRPSGLVKR